MRAAQAVQSVVVALSPLGRMGQVEIREAKIEDARIEGVAWMDPESIRMKPRSNTYKYHLIHPKHDSC